MSRRLSNLELCTLRLAAAEDPADPVEVSLLGWKTADTRADLTWRGYLDITPPDFDPTHFLVTPKGYGVLASPLVPRRLPREVSAGIFLGLVCKVPCARALASWLGLLDPSGNLSEQGRKFMKRVPKRITAVVVRVFAEQYFEQRTTERAVASCRELLKHVPFAAAGTLMPPDHGHWFGPLLRRIKSEDLREMSDAA